jgi:hypothetical protein
MFKYCCYLLKNAGTGTDMKEDEMYPINKKSVFKIHNMI